MEGVEDLHRVGQAVAQGGLLTGDPHGQVELAWSCYHGYRNFENYRLRMLLAASGTRTRRISTRAT